MDYPAIITGQQLTIRCRLFSFPHDSLALLRHFLFGAVHLLVAAQALLMIGAEQRGAPVIRLGARGVACAALRHLLFRLKRAVMVAARAQRGIFGVKIGCQIRFVDALGQLLHNFQMLELCRFILFFKQLDLPLFFYIIGNKRFRCRRLAGLVQAFKAAAVTGAAGRS